MAFNMGQAIGYLMLDTTGFTTGLGTAKAAMGAFFTQSNSMDTRMKGLGTAATIAGTTLTKGLTLPLVGVGTAAVKVASDFDSQMSKVASISGATGEEFDALREKAREMGEKTQFSASEAGQAFEYMAMAGWKTEDMLGGIEGIMNLAAASGEDLATTSDIVTDALTAFGLTAKDSAHFADVLAVASSNSNTNVAMMGETFKYVAPVAGAMGYSAEDTAVAIGLMANSGIKASQAGTALRNILTNMANPTDNMAKAMDTLGVKLDDGNGNMLSLKEVMDQLRSSFGDLKIPADEAAQAFAELDQQLESGAITQEQYDKQTADLTKRVFGAEGAIKAQTASMLAGKNGMSGLLAIVNASEADYNKLTNAVDHASDVMVKTVDGAIIPMSEAMEKGIEWTEEFKGTSEQMAAVMKDNLAGQLKILISQLQELAISIGDILMPYIRGFVSIIQDWVDKFNKLDDNTKDIIVKIGLFVAAIGPVLLILGKVFTAIGTIISVGTKLKTMFLVLSTITKVNFSSALTALVPVLSVLKTAFASLFAVIAANPIVLIIAAIAALVAAFIYLWTHCEKFREFWINLWEKLKSVVSTAIEAIKEFFNRIINFVKNNWQELLLFIVNPFAGAFAILYKNCETFRKFWGKLWDALKKIVSQALQKIKDWIKQKLSDMITSIKNTANAFQIVGKIIFTALYNGMTSVWSSISSWVSGKVNWIKDRFNDAKNWLTKLKSSGSYATGTDYIFSDRLVQVHEGEAILSKEENKARTQGEGFLGGTIPIVLNITETIDGMTLAKNQYHYNLKLDKQHGVSLIQV